MSTTNRVRHRMCKAHNTLSLVPGTDTFMKTLEEGFVWEKERTEDFSTETTISAAPIVEMGPETVSFEKKNGQKTLARRQCQLRQE